ncbi:BMP family ABC transporter substrate-binding protein [Vulcanibacillus modesticaldus]|uniref:BMP family ABC transporter substrate-binding protein n=1 Tax=Vulcanibacillus modesticaldus TaxID=337097 RepID=A0A1D2YXQ4_9BACI|nr:BMP family ABC transporter substrate-binding protein [Vulcanibacillus modesticaldus]OEG00463.1 BMP family ABC transporter substrate-binding protein [Vulcanibacillus modesticaldus]
MKKYLLLLILVLGISTLLAGCGTDTENGAENNQGTEESLVKIGMVTDVGGVNDNSFNQSAWEGLQLLDKDLKGEVKVDFAQSTSDAEYIPNLTQFVKAGWDLTWGIGFLMGDHVKTVAEQNPEAKLAIIDAVVDAPNVASVTFKEHEGSFLVGVVAGLMTKTDKIGFVGGMDIPVIARFDAGFTAGVKAANPDAKIIYNYTGAFDKPDLGKAAAATMYDQGVDIIFHAAGATGDGVFNEAKARKDAGQDVWVIGVDKDQSITFGDDITLTSMMKRVDQAVYRVSKELVDGEFKPGLIQLGLKENGVGLPAENPNIPADVLEKVNEFKQKIINGEIEVPSEK